MTEPIRIVVVGAGGHGREVCDLVELLAAAGSHQLVGVVDDDPGPHHLLLQRGVSHLGPVDVITELPGPVGWALGVGDPATRRALDQRLTALDVQPASLVHPGASVGSAGHLGPGLLLAAGARLTTNVTTGRHVHLNVNATASHDCVLGDHVILNPGAHVTGGVTLGEGVMVGAGAVVRQGTTVGAGAVIGAGAVVVDDVDPGTTVVGVPARPIGP